jgi:hypothetical protein
MAILLVRNNVVENIFPQMPPPGWSLPGHTVEIGNADIGWIRSGEGWVDPNAPQPDAPSTLAEISRPQAAAQLLAEGRITPDEAVAMARTAAVPAFVEAELNKLPTNIRIFAYIDFAKYTYNRNHPTFESLMSSAGFSAEELDAFFLAAAQR